LSSIVCNPVEIKIHLNIEVENGLREKKNIREGKYKNKVTEPAINLTLTN
jgi:hypothetical protein